MVKKRYYSRPWRHILRFFRRQLRTKKLRQRLLVSIAVIVVVSLGMMQSFMKQFSIHPEAYTPLLDVIAKGESGGNYNAYFGNSANESIRFTEMTIDEVLQWQAEYVAKGNVSSAVGKYQIIQPTLTELVGKLQIATDEKFDKPLQDRMAVALLERRGAAEYVSKKLTREQFAANLAKEWAALPKMVGPNPSESYYAADGVNVSTVSQDEMNTVLGILQKTATANL